MTDDTAARLRAYVLAEFAGGRNHLDDRESLIASGLIDSLAMLSLLEFIEATFDVTLEAEDLTADNFETIAAMVALIDRRRGA